MAAQTKIYIIGAGAVGSYLAGKLSGAADVVRVSRRDTAALGSGQIRWIGTDQGEALVPTLHWQALETLEPDAWVWVTCKAYDFAEVLPWLAPRIATGQPVVLLQNGLGIVDEARAFLPDAQLYRGVVWFGVRPTSGKRWETVGQGPLELAGFPPELRRELRGVAAGSGLELVFAENAQELEWRKALLNLVLNGLCGVLNLPNGAVLESPELRSLAELLLDQALAVAASEGVAFEPAARDQVWRSIAQVAQNRGSTVQDLLQGRRTEIPWLNAKVVELGRSRGLPVESHFWITQLVADREKNSRGVSK